MMDACLGVSTCDKCGEPMKEAQPILVITEGSVMESGDELAFHGSCIRYAGHISYGSDRKY